MWGTVATEATMLLLAMLVQCAVFFPLHFDFQECLPHIATSLALYAGLRAALGISSGSVAWLDRRGASDALSVAAALAGVALYQYPLCA